MENNKKLERSCSNRVIAGVCSGLAEYFNIDIALMRVLFVVSAICGTFGFWMYIILWIVLPEEKLFDQGFTRESDTIDITPKDNKQHIVNGAMIASLILIFIGLIALIDNFAFVAWIWKLWPVTLIIAGVVILINSQKRNNDEQ